VVISPVKRWSRSSSRPLTNSRPPTGISPRVGSRLFPYLSLLLVIGMSFSSPAPATAQIAEIRVQSDSFDDGETMPVRHTVFGENLSPPISWSNVPAGTRSFVLIMHDRDMPIPGGFVHWVVYNIPGSAVGLPEGLPSEPVLGAGIPEDLAGMTNGVSDMRTPGYSGPQPMAGTDPHHYIFTVYALDRDPDLEAGLGRNQVLSAVRDDIIGQGIVTGVYARD